MPTSANLRGPSAAGAAAASSPTASVAAAEQHSPCVATAHQFYHLTETNDFSSFAKLLAPDVKWRQRGLLQGRRTYVGAESVHKACLDMHATYMDLNYTVNAFAEEGGRSVLFWTASGVNRVGLFGRPATFHRSTFSGVSLVYLTDDGRIKEIIEYRQPTHEEMVAFLRRDPQHPDPAVERLLMRGHAVPQSDAYCHVDYGKEISPSWRVQAVQLATEWVETWTPSMSLEDMITKDMEEFHSFGWPDFDADLVGRKALWARCAKSAQEGVLIRDTFADSATNIVAIHWHDFEQLEVVQQELLAEAQKQARALKQETAAKSAAAAAAAAPPSAADRDLPDRALPREQPSLHPEHGSVEMVNGQPIVHLSPARRSTASIDDPPALPGGDETLELPQMHKYRGVSLFGLDADCKLAWEVTFRELKASEEMQYLTAPPVDYAKANLM